MDNLLKPTRTNLFLSFEHVKKSTVPRWCKKGMIFIASLLSLFSVLPRLFSSLSFLCLPFRCLLRSFCGCCVSVAVLYCRFRCRCGCLSVCWSSIVSVLSCSCGPCFSMWFDLFLLGSVPFAQAIAERLPSALCATRRVLVSWSIDSINVSASTRALVWSTTLDERRPINN